MCDLVKNAYQVALRRFLLSWPLDAGGDGGGGLRLRIILGMLGNGILPVGMTDSHYEIPLEPCGGDAGISSEIDAVYNSVKMHPSPVMESISGKASRWGTPNTSALV